LRMVPSWAISRPGSGVRRQAARRRRAPRPRNFESVRPRVEDR
jgi:hypothetical protein